MKKSVKRYTTVVLVAIICLPVFAGAAQAGDFQADVVQKTQGMEMKGKFYVKDNKTRMDMNMMGQKTSTITRMDKKVVWVVQHNEGMYIEMPVKAGSPQTLQFDEELKKIAVKKKIGSEEVNGFKCDKYEIVYHDKQMGKMITWISKKLNFPIKTVHHGPQGDMYTEYKNIKVGKVKDSLFETPQGFQKMSMPVMGQGMGGPMPGQ